MNLTTEESADLLQRYNRRGLAVASYATVADYCDSADHLRWITDSNGDLKNVQRPWAVKAMLGCVPPPARILEVGGGEPVIASFLNKLGYDVTLIDPYDGSGNGPREFEVYQRNFPNVRLVRDYLRPGLDSLAADEFDAIFSISVLEHLTAEACYSCFSAFAELLKPKGVSLHCFDFILQGGGHEHDLVNARRILQSQARLGAVIAPQVEELLQQLQGDLEAFYLSPQGHNLWRGRTAYHDFPFRKVVSLQTAVRRA